MFSSDPVEIACAVHHMTLLGSIPPHHRGRLGARFKLRIGRDTCVVSREIVWTRFGSSHKCDWFLRQS